MHQGPDIRDAWKDTVPAGIVWRLATRRIMAPVEPVIMGIPPPMFMSRTSMTVPARCGAVQLPFGPL